MAKIENIEVWASLVVILLAAILYIFTLDTGLRPDELSGGDLITHQYAQVQARPSNAPGYPLYTMGGWLWFHLTSPLLSWALNPVQRLSTYSTLWALLSLAVLYHLILRATRGNWPIAALSSAFYATTYFFWFYSVTTEQYTSAVFQTLLIAWLAFRWDEAETQGQPGDRYLLLLAFVIGTCLANLVTTLFIVPPLLWFVLDLRPDLLRRPKLILGSALVLMLPMISYAYVYARGAAHPEWRGEGQWPSTWAWFLDFVTTQQGRDELAPGLVFDRFFTAEFPSLIWGELTWIVLIGGLVGLWWLGRRRAYFIYGTLALYLLFCWVDRFGNWFQVIIPAYPLVVLGFGVGLDALWSRQLRSNTWLLVARGLILATLFGLVAYRLTLSLPRADQSHLAGDVGLNPGWKVLADGPLASSVIIGDHDEWLALSYLTHIWDAEPPIDPRPLCQPDPSYLSKNVQTSDDLPAIYLTRRGVEADPACLAGKHRYAAGANLIQIWPVPNTQLPGSARPEALSYGPNLTLVGFEVRPSPGAGPEGVRNERRLPKSDVGWHISLYWKAEAPMESDYTVSVRPLRAGDLVLDENGEPLIQDHQPVWNSYPTSRWTPGEIVRDDYVLYLPNGVTPDAAQVVVYRTGQTGVENVGQVQLNLTSDEAE
jgi:hypothetical protein